MKSIVDMQRLLNLTLVAVVCCGAGESKVDQLIRAASSAHGSERYALIQRALVVDPDNGDAYACRGRCRFDDGDYSRAIEDCTTAIDLNSKHSLLSAHNIRYHAYMKMGKWEEALAACISCEKIGHEAGAAFDAAYLCRKLGRAADAAKYERLTKEDAALSSMPGRLQTINASLAHNPNDQLALSKRWHLYRDMNMPAEAIRDLSKLMILNPDQAWSFLMERADMYWSLHKYKEAAADYRKMLVLKPPLVGEAYKVGWITNDEVRSRLGICLRALGDYDAAIKTYTEALKFDPDEEEAYRYRGECYAAKHDYKNAIQDYTEAIRRDPESAGSTYLARAEVYDKCGQNELAERDKAEALKLGFDPKKPLRKEITGASLLRDADKFHALYSDQSRKPKGKN